MSIHKMSIIDIVKKEKRDREEIEERMEELYNRISERTSAVIPPSRMRIADPYVIPHGTVSLGVSPRTHRKALYSVTPAGIRERQKNYGERHF